MQVDILLLVSTSDAVEGVENTDVAGSCRRPVKVFNARYGDGNPGG